MARLAETERARLGRECVGYRPYLTEKDIQTFLVKEKLLSPRIDPDYRREKVNELERSKITAEDLAAARQEIAFWKRRARDPHQRPEHKALCRRKASEAEARLPEVKPRARAKVPA